MAILNIPGVGPREVPDNLSIEDKLRLMTQLQSEVGIQGKPQFGLGELFTRGVERGYERTKSTFGDVLPAMVASAFGADEYAKRQMEEARASQEELERRLPAMYKSYKDIGGVKDFLGYAVETLGEVAPDIATSLVPGGVGAVVGRGVATQAARQALAGAARQGLAREAAVGAAEKAAEKAATRGMLAGTYLGSYAQNAPEVFQSIYEETGNMNAATAALFGGLSAALDSILPAKVLDQLGTAGKGVLIKNLAEAQGAAPSVVKTIGKGVAKGMASEGLTESAQEFVNNLAVKTLKENYDLLSPENIDKYIDSFLRGAIAGGGVSLPTSAIEAARERSLARTQEQQRTAETAEKQRVETEQLEQQQQEQQKQQILQSIPQGVAPIEIGKDIFTVEKTASAGDPVPPAYVVSGAQFSREVKTLDDAEQLKASIESTREQDIAEYEKKVQATQEKLAKLDEDLDQKQRDVINISPDEFTQYQNEVYTPQREQLINQLAQEETILQRLDQPVTIKPKIRADAPSVPRASDEYTLFKHTPEGRQTLGRAPTEQDAEAIVDRFRPKEAPIEQAPPEIPEELGGTEVTAGPELDELKQELNRLGLPEVGLKLMSGLTGAGSPVDGAFGQQTIYVAMTPAGRSRKQALHHEFIHALKEAGLFTPSEWKALSGAAKSDWMKRKWPNLGNRTIPETYGDLDLEGQIEEAIAVAFEHYTQKQYAPAMKVATAFQKIKNFLGRVKNFFTGKGYQTADDVFDFVASGAMRYKIRLGEVSIGPTKLAKAPDWVPQKIWDLHEKVERADDEASGRVPLRPNQQGQMPRPGDLKRNQTLTFRRLSNEVDKYVSGDSKAANDLMVRMNEESNRRAEKDDIRFARAPNIQYHGGDLGFGYDTVLGRMDGGRGTGHFGTGVYFVSSENKLTDTYKARGVKEVDLSRYNLFKPESTSDAKELHDALRLINRLASDSERDDPITLKTAEKELKEIFYKLPFDIRYRFKADKKIPFDEVENLIKTYAAQAAEEARKLYKDYRHEYDFLDSASTRFMKKLGYDGVDVKGTSLDNIEYGTVVYAKDLSSKENKPVRDIKFARAPSVESKEFKQWFGDSKVVDKKGKPLVLYHGTNSTFTAFRPRKAALGMGMYFTNDKKWAKEFGGNVMPVYLSIKNPLTLTGGYGEEVDQFGNAFDPDNIPSEYDGIIHQQSETAPLEVVAFNPDQIKSATGNVGAYGQREVTKQEAEQVGLTPAQAKTAQKKGDIRFARSIRTTPFGRVIMVNDIGYYNPKQDNFNNQVDLREVLHSSIPQPVIRQADEYVEQFYASKPEVKIAPEERARAEELLAPKIDLAKQAKATYDQMILNIVNKTDSIGQMLAPIKGIKRAAEKLVEEKFEANNIKDLLRSTIVVADYSQLQDVVNAINQNFNILRIKNRSENPIVGPNVQTEPRKKFGGYSDVMINIRMPNGIVAEIQINSPIMLAAKDEQGHKLYEAAREQPEGSELYRTIYEAMEGFYDAAFLALNALRSEAQTRKARSDIGAAPLFGTGAEERVSPESSSLKEEPSGKMTISSPENVATNLVPSGKESGTRIIVPPSSKVKFALSFPQAVTDARRDLKLKRLRLTAAGKDYPGAPKNERMVLSAPGKPDFVTGDITIDDWKNRVQSLLSPQEIKSFGNWYNEIYKLFKQYFPKGDKTVDNYMTAWLVANQNTDVATAMKNALLQAEQIGRKMPESQMRLGGLETATVAARNAIRGLPITEGVGVKISDFVDSALGKRTRTFYGDHAVGADPFVVDIHTARDTGLVDPILINHLKRLGYNVPDDIKIDFPMGPAETQYENRADFGREMTKRLNAEKWMGKSDWKPAEIQAIGWMAMTRLTADAVESTRTALERNLQRISMEAAPGDGSPYAEKYGEAFGQMAPSEQAAVTQVLTTMAIDAAQDISGIKLSSIVHGMGGWQHFQNPATVAQTLATPEGADIAANVIGYLLQQTEVWSNKAKPVTKNPRAFAIDFIEAPKGEALATNEGIRNFWEKIMEADPTKLFVGYQPIKTADGRHGIRVLVNKGGQKTAENILKAIDKPLKDMVKKQGLKVEVTGHEAEIIIARNDWTRDRDGGAYLERLVNLGVADPAAKLDPIRSQFEDVYRKATGVRFARSPESEAGPSGSGNVVLGRTRKADASEVKGIHYGNKLVDKLLGSMYGTGIKGAERQRLSQSADERIKKRVYFYIEKPDGRMPPIESGLGSFVYTQNFGNILAPGEKMSDMFAKANRDFNSFESAVVNAGYDGYAVPSMGMMVILNHDVPVNYEGTRDKVKFAKAAQEGIPPNVLKAQAMERLNEVSSNIGTNGFNLARSPVTAKAGMNVLNQFVDQAPTFGKQVVQRILDMPKNNRAMVYKFLTLEQLADVGQNILPELKDYYETFQDMTGYREKQIYYAQKIAERLAALRNKSPEMIERLADLCNDATLLGFDPDPAKKSAGMSLPIMKLKGEWNKLNQEAKDLYVEMRNFYENRFNAYQAMLQDRIDRSVADPAARQSIMEKFRKMFESARNKGPYFPLSRFGQYWVSFEQNGIKNFRMFETLADSQRFQKELDAQGTPHNQGVRGDTMITDGIPSSQIQEIIGLVDTAGNPGELKQQIWNTYISMLPEVSMRKHFLPRKGTPGYSNDIVRSFSENTFHGAYALARLKYAPDFEANIDAMKKREKDLSGEKDAEKRSELLREVESRQQYIDNPTDTNFFTNIAGTIGFTWFLTAPASAITNLAQNVTVAFPILSAKFGAGGATREMTTAYKQFMSSAKRGEESVFDIQRTLQQLYNETKSAKYKREMDAINALMDNGTLSRTQTMDLAQLSDKPSMVGTRFHSTMKYVGMLFHGAEVMNRTTTALAAFRLSYDKHKSLGEAEAYQRALKDAREITRKAHFDYSASNKPPIMQGKTARVVFMFKQYGQHMAYMLLRETQLYGKYLIDKYRGTPMQAEAVARAKEARDTVIGILCTTGMFSGVFGLPYPLYVLTITIANALFGDDEDELFDAETRFKLWLTDTLGAGPADIIAKGPASYLLGADISDRISANGLIFRDFGRLGPRQAKDEDQVAAMQQFLVEIAGPMGGLAMNVGQGVEAFKSGQVYRGIEKMLPAPLRDAMETYRYNTEGVLTLKGDPILDEVSNMQSFINLIGFSPVELARQYEENAAIKAVESQANMERKRILNKFALATNNHDFDALEDIEAAIERYNEKFPSYEITGKTLSRSLKARDAAAAENENGVRVTKRLAGIAERGSRLTGTE